MKTYCVVAVLLVTSQAFADETARKKFIEECKSRFASAKDAKNKVVLQRQAEHEQLKAEHTAITEAPITGKDYSEIDPRTKRLIVRHASVASRTLAIEKAMDKVIESRKLLEKAKNAAVDNQLPTMSFVDAARIEVGQIGVFSFDMRQPAYGVVEKIIDDNNMLVRFAKFSLWVETKTTGLVDGKRVVLSEPFEVTGTQKYNSRTVFRLKPFVLTEAERKFIRGD